MAMGKGIVASRLGQIGDVLEDGQSALLVEPGNVNALARAIERLAADKQLLATLGETSRKSAIDKHTWLRNAERVLETFRNLS
jgi:glycosyltransferase involved in cell wall biosynthesis